MQIVEEGRAGAAFSRQSEVFDDLDEKNPLAAHLRRIVRKEVTNRLQRGSEILELNCGTGIDALFFASQGYRVHATDVSEGMIAQLKGKLEKNPTALVTCQQMSFEHLDFPEGRQFDLIYSNFGGLNCSPDLRRVLGQFKWLVRPGGLVSLVVMPKICPWELVMVLKGQWRTAFRRFRKATPARVEGLPFYCYYYGPSYVKKTLAHDFEVLSTRGIFITVPPEFYKNFVERYPRLYKVLSWIDQAIGARFPFNRLCDHYLITLRRKA